MTQTPGGYNGKILRVNLTRNTISVEALDELFCRKYVGGAGFALYYLWKELQPGIEALSPDNKLVFAVGPLTGQSLAGTPHFCAVAKSPLTGGIGKAEAGGFWGPMLKRAGFDGIIVEGKAVKPVYLWIHDGEASLRDAAELWGKNTKETQDTIRTELNDHKIQVAAIGPAGENLVRYASIMSGLHDTAGRGGLGAVMGSKNLKAICVKGDRAPAIANPDGVKALRQWMLANMQLVKGIHDFGSGAMMDNHAATGNLPVRNFRDGLFPGAISIDSRTVKDTIRVDMRGCFGCAVQCKKVVQAQEPYLIDPAYGGPEYESLAALGSNCGVDNLKAVAKANELCNAYGLDTISAGDTIAFAMECFEKGLLTLKDTGGIELRFGNSDAMLKVIELIARQHGIGSLLAEGTVRAVRKIGRGAEELAMQVKGLELPMHEPRLKPALALGYMVNPHGGDHCTGMQDNVFVNEAQITELKPLGVLEPLPMDDISPRKVYLFKLIQSKQIINDALTLCRWLPYSFNQIASVTAAVTGWNTGVMEQVKAAERILTIARLFNIREGFTSSDDNLPGRFFQPKTDGALSSKSLDPARMDSAKRFYYTLMGWDAVTGIPLPEKIEELGIH